MAHQNELIDTHLLRVLHTILTECSVTRAAVKLDQSQPAVSAALRRLREITSDPLLVRGERGMVSTAYGLRLLESAQNALDEIGRIGVQQHNFGPATSIRCFRIGCPDFLNPLFVPTVVALFLQAAPHATLEFQSLGPSFDYEVALEEGELDIVIGDWPEPPEQLHLANYYARSLPLTVLPAPLDFPKISYYQLWHERCHYSDEIRWLRNLIATATKTLVEQPPPPHEGRGCTSSSHMDFHSAPIG